MASGHLLPQGTRRGWIVAGFTATTLVLGGGGSPTPAAEMLVQLAFAAGVILWVWWAARESTPADHPPRSLMLLAALILALPLLHLVPLPPALWQALPGRALEAQSLALAGAEDTWRPLSIAPYRTLAAWLAMIPAAVLMLAVAMLDLRDRRLTIGAIALVALAGAVLGALQLAGGDLGAFQLYEMSHRGWLTGFFANRNAAVDALLIGSIALTTRFVLRARARPVSGSALAIFLMLQAALLLAAVLTGSRAGIVLIAVALLFQLVLLKGSVLRRTLAPAALAAAGIAALLLVVPLAVSGNRRLADVAQRFDAVGDARTSLWTDTAAAIGAYWPVGSGIGSFTRAFQPYERLEAVDEFFPNRAHNDYLEFLLEAGMLAPLLLLAALVILARLARVSLRVGGETRLHALFALGALAVLGLHSIVDYPLRTMALAALAGVAAGLLAPPRGSGDKAEGTGANE